MNERLNVNSIEETNGMSNSQTAVDIEIEKISSFKNHPFKVVEDEKMMELVESIKANGIISPVLIRPCGDAYEMISGHRRLYAAKLAGLVTIPSIVRTLTDDEAVIAMVDGNIQREELLPSEKAYAYKMKMEAMKNQGTRKDLNSDSTSTPNGWKSETASLIGEQVGESKNQVRRYIRLTELISELLDLVDTKKLNFTVAVEISYIDKKIQEWLYQYIQANGSVKAKQIAALREAIEKGPVTKKQMNMILDGTLTEKRSFSKITITNKKLKEYFPKDYTKEDIESIIFTLLDKWKNESIGGND